MLKKHIQNKETRIYLRCLFLLPFFLLLALLFHLGYSLPALFLPPCLFHTLTGFSCPGCGCTRAAISLLHGDIMQSLRYNPVILYCAVIYILFVLSHSAAYISSYIFRKFPPADIAQSANKKKLPSHHREPRLRERSLLHLLNQIHGMKASPVYLYILIWLLLIFGILRFFAELWQRFH